MRLYVRSLQSQLILLIIVVALPALIFLIIESIDHRRVAIDSALKQAVTTIDALSADQLEVIENTKTFLQRLSSFPIIIDPEPLTCNIFLAHTLKLYTHYVNLGVSRVDGELLCNGRPFDEAANVTDRTYIQRALATRSFSIGNYQINRITGVTSIDFAYPVIDPNSNEITGIAVADVSLSWWGKRLAGSHLPRHAVAYITDHKNTIIATYPNDINQLGSLIKSPQDTSLSKSSAQYRAGKVVTAKDGSRSIVVSRQLSTANTSHNITITVGIPFDTELSAIHWRLIKAGTLQLFFIILILIIATWAIRRSVLDPLNDLLESTKNLELGNTVIMPSQQGATELVELGQRFFSMATVRLNAEQQLKDSQVSLKQSENALLRHIENTPLGYIAWDRDFNCTEWNKSSEKIFGYTAKEAIGRHASELIIAPRLRDRINSYYASLIKRRGGIHKTTDNTTQDGRTIICEWSNTPIVGIDGQFYGVASLVQDVTTRKQLEEKQTLAASVFSHAREGIFITDAAGIIIDVNEAFIGITGYRREEVIGYNPRVFKSNEQPAEFFSQMWDSLADKSHWHGEIWNRRKNGEIYPLLLTISAVYGDGNRLKNYVASFSDISLLKRNQQQLEQIAHYDTLTNLPNRMLLADRLEQTIVRSKRLKKSLAVAFLDLDGFKAINDAHGHSVGDELLVTLALRMREALREGDTLSRFGGDEFVVLLDGFDNPEDYDTILRCLLNAAAQPVAINDTILKVSASIGVTLFPADNSDADQLIRHADRAMYVAKEKGKNCYQLFDIASDGAMKSHRESLQQITSAFGNREFVLYYQPKVNMKTGAIIGAEALIRWQHPKRGLLSPIDFLPVIEDHVISIDIGAWVIDTALSQIAQWQAQGINISVSVNVSALQLQQKDFASTLANLLAAHPDVKPSALQLEVLETSALGDLMDVSEVMHKCLTLGVSFAIDDFGTGYSSLTYLRRLPAHLIKIDQTFIRDMLDDPDDFAIVTGVIALAKSFEREVIAEGVETIAHGTALVELGCHLAQGYGIAEPMPADKMPRWATNWQPDSAWLANTYTE